MNMDFFSQRHKVTQRSQSICLISSLLPKNLRFFRDFYRLKKRHRTKTLRPLRSLCLCEKIIIHAFDMIAEALEIVIPQLFSMETYSQDAILQLKQNLKENLEKARLNLLLSHEIAKITD